MTTRYEDNHLGCVIKYLKKIFEQCYDVIMMSSIGPFSKIYFWKPKLFKTHFTPRSFADRRNLITPIAKYNHLNFQKITRNLVLPLSVIVQSRDQYITFLEIWPQKTPILCRGCSFSCKSWMSFLLNSFSMYLEGCYKIKIKILLPHYDVMATWSLILILRFCSITILTILLPLRGLKTQVVFKII